ncbi:AraC-like DNA-binding protein/mannose-6-phosphate isomerase-like protein (cupin superfamily) [Paenibacillus forsythiae]|uniref:AraC-like DNA-binding protein/mannose-6-phosphate isomerase-like protein (Cupin superfamily) n=1 Tax=Paenibacillus forsythiae TaxID=365616 RepID=A0ABU3H226_9BACL|nr:AraC family transcriptional regulator [Paenibacillus forsythiae]MDT3424867.1 AraC-like DNA-binding protein/mannose-6-phosphate isomerase-like protein (cupin superfamily) [Paenibacillus forsythiae]
MTREVRTVVFDADLELEAYRFEGIMQKFPNHFHDYYVIGFIEQGKRLLHCHHEEYILNSGDVVIFNPYDPHACEQIDGGTLDYRCINIQPEVMRQYVQEIAGVDYLPCFTPTVLYRSELAASLRELHLMISEGHSDFQKEELLLFLLEQLLREDSDLSAPGPSREPASEIKRICEYIESHFAESITLDQLSQLAGLSKYHLLRSFTKQKGISPYSYLATIRINHAKKLLEQGMPPIDVALQTSFSDQSHFTNYFKKLIGLTPKQYARVFIHGSGAQQSTEITV